MQTNQLELKTFFKQQKELSEKAQKHIIAYTKRSLKTSPNRNIVNKFNKEQQQNTQYILYGR